MRRALTGSCDKRPGSDAGAPQFAVDNQPGSSYTIAADRDAIVQMPQLDASVPTGAFAERHCTVP
jgi:hypothetical protein